MTPAKKQELLKRAAVHLNLKLKLERRLLSNMRQFLTAQNQQFLNLWQAQKRRLNASVNREDLERILYTHYHDAGQIFSPMIVEDAEAAIAASGAPQDINERSPELLGLLLLFATSSARTSAGLITDTSNREMQAAIELSEGDGGMAAARLQGRVLPRAQSIAVTETQMAVEGAKNRTAVFVQTAVPAVAVASAIQTSKAWMTQMDSAVRPAHSNAIFQERKLSEPFDVGGEQLMYPGDTSLGASPWNVVHCRCSAIYDY
jgi:hypothetical protein